MAGLTIICMSDVKTLSKKELQSKLREEKAKYKKKLLDICSSKEIRQQAKRISKRKDSCNKCVFCDGVSDLCYVPYSDLYMEDLNIDPCFEGVLRYLVGKGKA